MDNGILAQILRNPELCTMGHGQDADTGNLGMGWLYYALARMYRPNHVVCIGSWRGFVPLMFAQGLHDNGHGRVTFIDPGMVDDHWHDPGRVKAWFQGYGTTCIDHYCMTTQEFVDTEAYAEIQSVDILFVDGMHTCEQAQIDHQSFLPLMNTNSIALFHDSVSDRESRIYGQPYGYTVYQYMDQLRQNPNLQVLDLPFENGLTMVRQKG